MSPTPSATSRHTSGRQRTTAALVTGAGGEMGHGLIQTLAAEGGRAIVALDIRELSSEIRSSCDAAFAGDICDEGLLSRLLAQYEISEIYHLAALLSTRGEFVPETAHQVNVVGTLNMLKLAAEEARTHGRTVRFFFPSSIAAYGMATLAQKRAAGRVAENQCLEPITMYGCSKLAGEHLGRYYERHYRLLAKDRMEKPIDFRSIRFPGIISADTVPSGGTSDYGPEMIHAAAQGRPYGCFVRADSRIPFMTMPEAVTAIVGVMRAEKSVLQRQVYNISSFAPSAQDFASLVLREFPGAIVTWEVDEKRQAIIDSWPEDIDDAAARADWGWKPQHDLASAFSGYLLPRIRARYE
ncbi:MAG: NAD-dependent epimerase/dehydratase family protein [Phycisphaerales bacterium]|nr:NAD-dependent epimerase/dehydratase family protein [Phycisphaerales bacterium]